MRLDCTELSMDVFECECLRESVYVYVAITNNVLSRDVSNQVNTRGIVMFMRCYRHRHTRRHASLRSIPLASVCAVDATVCVHNSFMRIRISGREWRPDVWM